MADCSVTREDQGTFDPTVFAKQYLRTEDVPGLDFSHAWDRVSLLSKLRELGSARPSLLERKFATLKQQTKTPPPSGTKFRLMQWNMLAQGLSRGKDNFVRCPDDALDWTFRRLRVLEEILETNPDVLCLQEVDHFGFLLPALKSVGYDGTFFPKPDSPALYVECTNGPDGCAMFFKEEKFKLLKKEAITLKAGGHSTNQVSVILTLQPRGQGSQVTVATTHLKAKYGWDDLRQKQGRYLLEYLQGKVGSKPLIVCGDFNADATEPVYRCFQDSPMGLRSAYKQLSEKQDREPPFTTWKIRGGDAKKEQDVCRTIDYVWFTEKDLQISSLRLLPTGEEMGKDRLPAFCYPSDHLSLAADFILCN